MKKQCYKKQSEMIKNNFKNIKIKSRNSALLN